MRNYLLPGARDLTSLALLCGLTAPVAAQDIKDRTDRYGIYSSAFVGVAFDLNAQDLDSDSLGSGEIDLRLGWSAVGAAVGYAFYNGFRVEGSVGYTQLNVDSVSIALAEASSGELSGLEFMVNGYYDFLRDYWLQPYIGVGIGVQRSKYKDVDFTSGASFTLDDTAVEPAGQAIFGVGGWVADHIHLGLEYRFFGNFSRSDFRLSDGSEISTRFIDHRVLLGLRYSFGTD